MKKWLALVLVLALSLSLCACGGGGSGSGGGKNAIVGEWKSLDGSVVKFNKDGTGDVDGTDFTWKYDGELKTYTIAAGIAVTAAVKTENDLRFVEIVMTKYYHPDDHEKAYQAAVQNAKDEITSYTDGRTKIEIGKSYKYAEGITIEFLGATVIDYSNGHVCIDAAFTSDANVKAAAIYNTDYLLAYKTHYLHDNTDTSWVSANGVQWGANIGEYGGARKLEPGATVTTRGSVYNAHATPVEDITMMICCFELNGTEYYFDLTEYIK